MTASRPSPPLLPHALRPRAHHGGYRAEDVDAIVAARRAELAEALGLDPGRLVGRGRRRRRDAQVARWLLAYTLRHHDHLTYAEIARALGRRAPTAGFYFVRRGEDYVAATARSAGEGS